MTKRDQRLRLIAEWVTREGFVPLDAIVERLGVSKMTVHRDLDALHDAGVLRKVRGGASAHRSAQFESDLPFRSQTAVAQKRAIARAASVLASEGDVIIIDDSTTALEVIPHVVGSVPVTVITNFLLAMHAVESRPNAKLVGLGGEYVNRYKAFLGLVCERTLADLYADVLFASTSSLRGVNVYHQDQRVVSVKRAMMAAAQRRVLLMDHTKFGHGALHKLGGIDEFTHVVVDDGVDDHAVAQLRETGVSVIVAPTAPGAAPESVAQASGS